MRRIINEINANKQPYTTSLRTYKNYHNTRAINQSVSQGNIFDQMQTTLYQTINYIESVFFNKFRPL